MEDWCRSGGTSDAGYIAERSLVIQLEVDPLKILPKDDMILNT